MNPKSVTDWLTRLKQVKRVNPISRWRKIRLTLFWRTFLLIALLLGLSLFGWYRFFVWFERGPRAQQFAEQLVSVVNLTRTALIYADPRERQNLLSELAFNEGIRVLPLEPNDVTTPLPDRKLIQMVRGFIQLELGTETRIVGRVNDQPGFWVSFSIEDDWYWVYFPAEKVNRIPALEWLSWGLIAILLSVVGALIIGRFLNRPLAQLTKTAKQVANRQLPEALPVRGPMEIRLLTSAFNHMLQDLRQSEEDRALMLAGISHDLRTPLTRLRLELEMAPLDQSSRDGMVGDLDQMEGIVRQFTDFARLQHTDLLKTDIELATLIEETLKPYLQRQQIDQTSLSLHTALDSVPPIRGNPQELQRVLINLIENALHYGHLSSSLDQPTAAIPVRLDISLVQQGQTVILTMRDYGPGVPESALPILTQPFRRLNSARTDTKGTGLGLAIVDRIVRRHQGQLIIRNAAPSGLAFELHFPLQAKKRTPNSSPMRLPANTSQPDQQA
ncbi:ATP-binding protein [Parvibium lacunae]|uniref:histidine kinase n=1 Tax=Parvibium lacunae TaxID=1888893 RepID=A0A368L7S5_9BURK|nr:ATP-binding protein [Parvibium lacunae]RCS59676.1 HAMP domain-containing protein [Parvibium lacunae]